MPVASCMGDTCCFGTVCWLYKYTNLLVELLQPNCEVTKAWPITGSECPTPAHQHKSAGEKWWDGDGEMMAINTSLNKICMNYGYK